MKIMTPLKKIFKGLRFSSRLRRWKSSKYPISHPTPWFCWKTASNSWRVLSTPIYFWISLTILATSPLRNQKISYFLWPRRWMTWVESCKMWRLYPNASIMKKAWSTRPWWAWPTPFWKTIEKRWYRRFRVTWATQFSILQRNALKFPKTCEICSKIIWGSRIIKIVVLTSIRWKKCYTMCSSACRRTMKPKKICRGVRSRWWRAPNAWRETPRPTIPWQTTSTEQCRLLPKLQIKRLNYSAWISKMFLTVYSNKASDPNWGRTETKSSSSRTFRPIFLRPNAGVRSSRKSWTRSEPSSLVTKCTITPIWIMKSNKRWKCFSSN